MVPDDEYVPDEITIYYYDTYVKKSDTTKMFENSTSDDNTE